MFDPLFGLKRLLQIGSRERRISVLKRVITEEASAVIKTRRRSVEDGARLGPDLLSRFLEHSKKVGQPMHDGELHSVVMNTLIAGRDTTACGLSWAFFELSKRPEIVQKIVEEADQVCGKNNPDYSYDKICQLRYTHAVVMEVLRLHPSLPNDHKYAVA